MDILKKLREEKSLTLEVLSSIVGISRQTLSKYEKPGVDIPTDKARILAAFFEIDYKVLITGKSEPEPEYEIIERNSTLKDAKVERVCIPKDNIQKFKEVVLYITKKIGSHSNFGQTVLYKLLYFIDFDYYELYEEQLIGASYFKNYYGPTPVNFKKIIQEMQGNGEIVERYIQNLDYSQYKYIPLRDPDLTVLTGQELEHINNILLKYGDKTATYLSRLSHKDMPWLIAGDKDILDYEAVFYRNEDTSVREYN